MERLCSNCKRKVNVSDKQIHESHRNEHFPFIGMKHVYQVKYFQCPFCMQLSELESQLIECWKDGKQVPISTPL